MFPSNKNRIKFLLQCTLDKILYFQVTLYSMFVAIMAFFARISDPAVGGTYMTMLNTLTNLGGNWPATLALWPVDHLTWKRCQIGLNEVKSSNIRYYSFKNL